MARHPKASTTVLSRSPCTPCGPSNGSVDIDMYISDSVVMPPFSRMSKESLVLSERNFAMDKSKKDSRLITTSISVPTTVQNNGTLWAHIFVAQAGAELDPSKPSYDTAQPTVCSAR